MADEKPKKFISWSKRILTIVIIIPTLLLSLNNKLLFNIVVNLFMIACGIEFQNLISEILKKLFKKKKNFNKFII